MRYVVIAMLMTLTCLDLDLAQAASVLKRETLRGLPGVYVLLEEIGKDAQADGLSEDALRTAVELILRSSGIRVLTQGEMLDLPTNPYLYVKASTHKSSPGLYIYCVTLEVSQVVSLVQRPQKRASVTTWTTRGVIGYVGQHGLRDAINSAVDPQVKEFTIDFLTVNPR